MNADTERKKTLDKMKCFLQSVNLTEPDVCSRVCQSVQAGIEPDETGRVDERACVAPEERVVGGAVDDDAFHLLHVGFPIDLSVGNFLDDDQVNDHQASML